jgi:hypothetical protein
VYAQVNPLPRAPLASARAAGEVLQTTKVDVKARGIAAIVGNIVADAAGTPTHWVYDQASLASQVANAGGEDKVAFMDPPINPFYHCPGRPGRLSALSVFHRKSILYGAFEYGRAGRLTVLFGGFRPGQASRGPTAATATRPSPSSSPSSLAAAFAAGGGAIFTLYPWGHCLNSCCESSYSDPYRTRLFCFVWRIA